MQPAGSPTLTFILSRSSARARPRIRQQQGSPSPVGGDLGRGHAPLSPLTCKRQVPALVQGKHLLTLALNKTKKEISPPMVFPQSGW